MIAKRFPWNVISCSAEHAGRMRDPRGEVKHTQILKVSSTFNGTLWSNSLVFKHSNCHESSKKCPAWELLDLGHKPEFKDMHLVKAKVVLSETGRWGYCINQLGSVPFLLGKKKMRQFIRFHYNRWNWCIYWVCFKNLKMDNETGKRSVKKRCLPQKVESTQLNGSSVPLDTSQEEGNLDKLMQSGLCRL